MTNKEDTLIAEYDEFEEAELQDARQELFAKTLDFASKLKQFPDFVDENKLNTYLKQQAKTLKIGVLK
jgi:hypothetical protein